MGSFIYALATGTTGDSPVSTERRVAAMNAMVEKYTASGFPAYVSIPSVNGATSSRGDTVLVTGTTGALGTYLLAELVANDAVSKVYAVNRPSSSSSLDMKGRQDKALLGRGLKASDILSSKKVTLVEADLSIPGFGVPKELYEEVRNWHFYSLDPLANKVPIDR